jgi:hypothetical protein
VFAEHGVSALLPAGQHYTTDLDHVTRFPTAGSPLAFVCDGEGLCVPDVLADPRLAAQAETLRANGRRSVVLAPLWVGRGWRCGNASQTTWGRRWTLGGVPG